MRAVKVLLVANLVLVLTALAAAVGLLFVAAVMIIPFVGDDRGLVLLMLACGLLAAAITWLTLLCLRAFDARLAVAIAVLSIPVYGVTALPRWESHAERATARRFLDGDHAASSEARAKLEAGGRRTNRAAVPVLVEGLRTVKDPERLRATIDLLGAIAYDSRRDSALVADALAAFARRGGGDTALRASALRAMRDVHPGAGDVHHARYEGLTDYGLALFHLDEPSSLHGERVSVAVDGLVLPRPGSSDRCEREVADKARKLLADFFAQGNGRASLRDTRIRDDGEYIAAVVREGGPKYDHGSLYLLLMMKELPWFEPGHDTRYRDPAMIDWCLWTAPAARR
jgi:hypothetical protein